MADFSRRRFGAFLLSGTALVGLSACASGTVSSVAVSTFKSDATLILAGVEAFADTTVQPLISDTDWSKIQGYESTAEDLLTSLSGLASTIAMTSGQSIVQQIETVADAAIGVLETYANLPLDVTGDITAIKTLMPIVLGAVSLAMVSAEDTGMTAAEARARLSRHKAVYRR